jgi:hypothetical protein
LFAAGAVAAGLSACHAQVNATAKVNGSEAEDDRKWEVAEAPTPPQEGPPAAPKPAPRVASAVVPTQAAAPTPGTQFLGVVHDLSLSPGAPRTTGCRCLAVAYGPPTDGKFTWQAEPLGEQDSIAIAIAPDASACNSAKALPRASISAIERDGTDIILVVENISEGRPMMHGALAASPGPNGAIVVRAKNGTPYPAASGAGACRIPLR